MKFTTITFGLFAAALLFAYYRIPKEHQWKLLLGTSMVFYIWAGLRYFLFLLITAASSFLTALTMDRNRREKHLTKQQNRPWLLGCLILNFGMLAVCKVFLLAPDSGCFLSLGLPLGMSFYMFQSMGYVIDVYRGESAQTHFGKYLLFVSYFPQLAQGPISKYTDLAPQLTAGYAYDRQKVSFGLQRMLWGYFKKLVIADRVAIAVAALHDSTGLGFLLLTLLYAVQIYGDFTGGIDIVLGLSQSLGIRLPENFIRPFFSKNTAEYWRRWHITLGTWMKTYIFYPVSISKPLRKLSKTARKRFGNFGKRLPVYAASLATWFVTGIWHGLTPNFVLWGMMNCAVIVISEELTPLYQKFHSRFGWKTSWWYGCFEILRTFLLMNLIRACDLFPNPMDYFRRVTSLCGPWHLAQMDLDLPILDHIILVLGIILMLTTSLVQEKKGSIRELLWNKPILREGLCFGLFLIVLLMGQYGVGYEASSFIYNQF